VFFSLRNQYFTTLVGQIVSPNFSKDPAGTRGQNLLNSGTDLANQDWKYCIRREKNTCCVLYQVCQQYQSSDLLTAAVPTGGDAVNGEAGIISEGWSFHTKIIGSGGAAGGGAIDAKTGNDIGLVDSACTTDYVEIPESTTGRKDFGASTSVNTRYCGHRFGNIPAITNSPGRNNHAPIWDCTEPFEVRKRNDQMNDIGTEVAQVDATRGLCLDFTQDQC
jgi:hypothetical protein